MSSATNNQVLHTLSSQKRHIREQKDKNSIEKWEKETSARAAKLYQKLGLKLSFRAKTMPEFAL